MCRMHGSNVGLLQSLKVQPNNPNTPILKIRIKNGFHTPLRTRTS